MPLGPYACDLLARLTKDHRLGGRIGFLGRLWPSEVTFSQVKRLLSKHGSFPNVAVADYADDRIINDKRLTALLGFSECLAIDFDRSEEAEIEQDLNVTPPSSHVGYFDVLYNNGTMEHIFHVPNFLENAFHYIKNDGIVIHSSPMNNVPEHGFYQFSPTFFFDYYQANDFEILECSVVEHDFSGDQHRHRHWSFNSYEHQPDPLYAKLGAPGNSHDVIFVARRRGTSTSNVVPTQFRYRRNALGSEG
ncbi:hypothetical protein [Azospirillum sp. TSO35-2]|uniref:hypothetical protein n=1 Tax=Azospirillum sp. TSO35-2 TaxID=716796 RepID=UPI0011B84E4E|nr:hypothetical protein [Azospirillum sp. TSO35-2]